MNHVRIEGLKKSDKSNGRDEVIEKAIKASIRRTLGKEFEKHFSLDQISFSFPEDETIISDNIPIVIWVYLILEDQGNDKGFYKSALAKQIWNSFRLQIIAWRKVGEIKVNVDFMDCDLETGGWYIA